MKRIGIVGARGYTGAELLPMLEAHPELEIALVGSRQLAGERVSDHIDGSKLDLRFRDISPEDLAEEELDVCVLALPNGVCAPFVAAIEERSPQTALVDLSSDHRFDADWQYGQPERFRDEIRTSRRIANPGCYATGMQLAIAPMLEVLDAVPVHVFGVSGYSGAGTTPSPKNDPEVLRDNLLPYALSDHTHELEVMQHFGGRQEIYFMPHVAPFFRGITLTISMELAQSMPRDQIVESYQQRYESEPLVRVTEDIPRVRDAAGRHEVTIGGFTVGQKAHSVRRLVVVATLDNLLKGAATQALQNINLVCGFDELTGVSR